MNAFFLEDGDRYVATELTRGPWSPDHQHAGPPAALLARALEREAGDLAVARMTVELQRPIPIAPLRVVAGDAPRGKRVRWVEASLWEGDLLLARARAVCIRRAVREMTPATEPGAYEPPPDPDGCAPYRFRFFDSPVGYHTAMELRMARGGMGQGFAFAWMRMRHPLLAGETPSPLQRVAIAADSGNGVSAALDTATHLFINPELTIHLFREPRGAWVGLEARTSVGDESIGLAESRLWDRHGPVGRGAQSLLVDVRR